MKGHRHMAGTVAVVKHLPDLPQHGEQRGEDAQFDEAHNGLIGGALSKAMLRRPMLCRRHKNFDQVVNV